MEEKRVTRMVEPGAFQGVQLDVPLTGLRVTHRRR